MSHTKDKIESDNYLLIFIFISLGMIIISIIFPFIINHFFSNWSVSGTFGDTFGALNAIFSGLAFTGVIVTILIQRTELSLQRTEMQETRKEFLLNRTTTLVYSQLDRFERSISDLTIIYNGKTYVGNDAILFLDDNKNEVYHPIDKTEEQYTAEMKEAILKLLKIYSTNKSQIEKFAHNAYNSVEVMKRLIFKTNLEADQLNDLKNLFFVNIGFINMGVIERMSEVNELEFKYLLAEDYTKTQLEVGVLITANIFLKSIKEFYKLKLTNENFDQYKAKWKESVRNDY
ncbi:hypothetical protein GXP67_33245 [Rhodocytophaga rosea]|uniref:Phage abortive infection protein n=1 Tax=Rhodocytophaga rosea TaxID=2704465 RepID=A0A6C0GTN9_9BACT|nr:hypothetical protein [Rhodocytophaga rosea]QHT71174.1 hypothetical protein GXP67_33245 [Rhodocytophaga rosea]